MKRLDRSEIIFKILSYVLLTIFALCCLYPFLFICTCAIFPSIAVSQAMSLSSITYSFWPFVSPIIKNLFAESNNGFDICISNSFSLFPELEYISNLFLFSIPMYLLNA